MNPNFGEVAEAVGLWGRFVSKAGELEESVETWLAQLGPALLHVKVKTDAVGDATFALRFTRSYGRDGGLFRESSVAGGRPRRLGDDGREFLLTHRRKA